MNTTFNEIENKKLVNEKSVSELIEKKSGNKDFSKMINVFSLKFLFVIVFLLPIFFIPGNILPFDYAKVLLGVFAVTIGLLSIGYNSFIQKRFVMPNSVVSYSSILVIVLGVVSAFMGPTPYKSFIGQGTETTTVLFVFTCISLMFIASQSISTVKRMNSFFKYFGLGVLVISLFQAIRLFLPADKLSLGVLVAKNSSLTGSWFDLGIFLTISVIFLSLSFQKENKSGNLSKVLMYTMYVLSVIFLVLINSVTAWSAIIGAGLVYFVGSIIAKRKSLNAKIETGSESVKKNSVAYLKSKGLFFFVTTVIAVVMLFFGTPASNWLSKMFSIDTGILAINRVALSVPFKQTLEIGKSVIKSNPIFGLGPNRFMFDFGTYKPLEINQTDFWQVDFTSTYGYFSTITVEYGLLAGISMVAFLCGIIYLSFLLLRKGMDLKNKENNTKFAEIKENKSISSENPEISSDKLIALSIVSIAMVIVLATFMPAQASMFIIFILFGVMISALELSGIKEKKYLQKQKLSIVIAILLLVLALVYFGLYVRKTIASLYFQSAVKHTTDKNLDIPLARQYLKSAIKLEPYDNYYQALAQVSLVDARSKIQTATQTDTATIEAIKKDIEESLKMANDAVLYDSGNYFNYVVGARISSALIPLNVQRAFDNAVGAYSSAISKNPTNPSLYFEAAKFLADNGKLQEAKGVLGKALEVKSNFQEAIFLLSQVQAAEGSTDEAINSVSVLVSANPLSQYLHFQLGYLKYLNKDYTGAIDALNNAVEIDTQYSNARYFLGLSYSKLGRVQDAIAQFVVIQKYNPDNKEVEGILSNLRAGRAPFAGSLSGSEPVSSLKSASKGSVQKTLNK